MVAGRGEQDRAGERGGEHVTKGRAGARSARPASSSRVISGCGAVLPLPRAEDLDRRHGPLRGQTVVDLGCGPGWYTRAFRDAGATVIPVDNDPAELELPGGLPRGALIADATALPLADASVDGAFCSNLLEHTLESAPVIAEIERVLRPGGWGYISPSPPARGTASAGPAPWP
jgi:SAM-dependent methyltransferase